MRAMTRPVVLVLDDNPYTRRALRRILHQVGFGVVEAADGRDAIDTVHHTYVDIALIDFLLPDMNGRSVADSIAQYRPKLPMICLTGAGEDPRMTCPPFDAILHKPVDIKHLEREIRAALKKAQGDP